MACSPFGRASPRVARRCGSFGQDSLAVNWQLRFCSGPLGTKGARYRPQRGRFLIFSLRLHNRPGLCTGRRRWLVLSSAEQEAEHRAQQSFGCKATVKPSGRLCSVTCPKGYTAGARALLSLKLMFWLRTVIKLWWVNCTNGECVCSPIMLLLYCAKPRPGKQPLDKIRLLRQFLSSIANLAKRNPLGFRVIGEPEQEAEQKGHW